MATATMTSFAPLCFRCRHFLPRIIVPTEEWSSYTCKAFPDGIPRNCLFTPHTLIVPGQCGDFVFTPQPDESAAHPDPGKDDSPLPGSRPGQVQPPHLVVAVASSALFDLTESDRVFREQGMVAYRDHQLQHEHEPLLPGAAFPCIRRLLGLNQGQDHPLVEVVLISHNTPDTGLRVRLSCERHGLPLARMAFTGGRPPWPYLAAFGAHLFLSRHAEDVRAAIAHGHAAGEILGGSTDDDPDPELRVAFDFDGVLADDASERIYREEGLGAFQTHECSQADIPAAPGPMARLLLAIAALQRHLTAGNDSRPRLRTAIVTARSWPADRRVMTTLRAWGIQVDEAFFLGHAPKEPVLICLRPHLFFDDRRANAEGAKLCGPAVHVPFGVNNR
jgi:5'-nucleotidase